MEEILARLLNNNLLTEDSRKEVSESVRAYITDYEVKTKAELLEQLSESIIAERNEFAESVEQKFKTVIAAQLQTLNEEISNFRDLEFEYKTKLANEKIKLTEAFEAEKRELASAIASQLDEAINQSFNELHTDLRAVRELGFGRKLFEAFKEEYTESYLDQDGLRNTLDELRSERDALRSQVVTLESHRKEIKREQLIAECLGKTRGNTREQLKIILENTENAEHIIPTFNKYITDVSSKLKTVANIKTPKVAQTITEGVNNNNKSKEVNDSNDVVDFSLV